jgi:nucleotide-binding universal stress UspA family protein
MLKARTFLIPTDFSEDSRLALEVALTLAHDPGARLVLLHVTPRSLAIGRNKDVPVYKEAHADEDLQLLRHEMAVQLDRLHRRVPQSVKAETLLKEGDVADSILSAAGELSADLIVMGTHGRSRAYQTVMGSVASAVHAKAPCPVVTVKGASTSPAKHEA